MDDLTDEEEFTIEKFIKWFKDNNYTQFDISIRSMKIEQVFGMWFTVTGKNHNNERVSFAPLQAEGCFITFPIKEKENFIKLSRKFLAENN